MTETDAGSTVPRRQLGRYLRQLRERSGITIKATADHLECSTQKIWRIEKGMTPVRGPDVRTLCQLYEADADLTQALVGLARETRAKGWWQSYGEAVPDWFELYVGLESAASRLRKFEPALVPGLLQARAYMECCIEVEQPGIIDADRQQRVAIKTGRQQLLNRHFPPPPQLDVIVWEPVLRASPATPGALQQQLHHLLEANKLAHVSVRVLPLAAGPHRASGSAAFTILEFPASEASAAEPPTIYSESLTGALYLDKPGEIAVYDEVWSTLADLALDEEQSSWRIADIMRELNAHA